MRAYGTHFLGIFSLHNPMHECGFIRTSPLTSPGACSVYKRPLLRKTFDVRLPIVLVIILSSCQLCNCSIVTKIIAANSSVKIKVIWYFLLFLRILKLMYIPCVAVEGQFFRNGPYTPLDKSSHDIPQMKQPHTTIGSESDNLSQLFCIYNIKLVAIA